MKAERCYKLKKSTSLAFCFLALFILIQNTSLADNKNNSTSPKLSPGKALKRVTQILKNSGLPKVPLFKNIVREHETSPIKYNPTKDQIAEQIVSGSPPSLTEIGSSGNIEEIFWRSGIVNAVATGTPTEDQCREYYSSNIDGESGGFAACFMAQGVGASLDSLRYFNSTQCNLVKFPTVSNFKSGGIKVSKGKLPRGGITKVFSPTSRGRLVLVNFEIPFVGASPERLYIKVPSENQNKNSNRVYNAEVFFCASDTGTSHAYTMIDFLKDGQLNITLATQADEANGIWANRSTLSGFLTPSGENLKWDPAKTRKATFSSYTDFLAAEGYRSEIDITPENLLVNKVYTAYGGNNYKNYSIAQFEGSNISTLGFLQGSFLDQHNVEGETYNYSGAFEFRDTFYASAPDNEFLDDVQTYDLINDSFFNDPISVDLNFTTIKCDAKADLVLAIDQTNTKIQKSLEDCAITDANNLYFCLNDETILQAENNYPNVCLPPQE